jgi:ferritin
MQFFLQPVEQSADDVAPVALLLWFVKEGSEEGEEVNMSVDALDIFAAGSARQ